MVKDAVISIRVEPSLKERLDKIAADKNSTLAAFAEQALNVHSMPPQWQLEEPEIFHTAKAGAAVKINVAEGWPVCVMSPARAEKLALDLLECARAAQRLTKTEYDVYSNRLESNKLAVILKGAKLPKNFKPLEWTLLDPPGGVAADIAYDIETNGVCILKRNFPYRPGEVIGGTPWK
jgi:predicted transcriptional regulator